MKRLQKTKLKKNASFAKYIFFRNAPQNTPPHKKSTPRATDEGEEARGARRYGGKKKSFEKRFLGNSSERHRENDAVP